MAKTAITIIDNEKIDNVIIAADRRRPKINPTMQKIPSQKATAAAMQY